MVTEQWMVEQVLKIVPDAQVEASDPVSYTHLTLPTTPYV